MFNMSALLQEDEVLNCVATEVVSFSAVAFDTDISQGSVATCGKIFSDSIITNFIPIQTVKKV